MSGRDKKRVSDHAMLILGTVWYLKHETKLTFPDRSDMFEKSGSHIVEFHGLTRIS